MKRLSAPPDVQIELTEKCNQKCFHCYNHWRYSEEIGKNELNEQDFLLIVKKLVTVGINSVTLTGGEPFLRPNLLFSILEYCNKNNIKASINSNATIIKNNDAGKIRDLGVTHVLVSLLGTEKTHNAITNSSTFKKACNGITTLIDSKVKVFVNMAVSKLNLCELHDVSKIAKDLGVITFCATPIIPSHQSNKNFLLSNEECKQMLRTLLKIKEEIKINIDTLEPIARCLFDEGEEDEFVSFFGNRICSAAVTTCAISSKGAVRPCIHADVEFGNLLNENFFDIWNKMKLWASPDILPSGCKSCKAVVICEGGCRMSAKLISGCYEGKDMYMKYPITNIERVQKLPFKERGNEIINFKETDVFNFNSAVVLRKEDFGGLVYVDNKTDFLTDKGFELLLSLKSKTIFSAESINREFGLEADKIIFIFKKLYRNKIIKKGGEKSEGERDDFIR
ncbi:MAG: radical SAM protein [Patescibacteria group bacterium]|nr:radical SAM protein [Patescibacteria group bacterium]